MILKSAGLNMAYSLYVMAIMKIYDKEKIDKNNMLFTPKALWALALPVMVEQLLNSLMGTADTMMVSNIGSAALSAVSLVDSINVMVYQIFAALATGGTIICSQYLGNKDKKNANKAADQVFMSVLAISLLLTFICVFARRGILRLVFGSVEEAVMTNSEIYFLITALSYPALALFNAGSAFFRAGGESKFPMKVSIISNAINIAGNAVLIFVFHMGVAGAAIATLASRIFSMIVVFVALRKPNQPIVMDHYLKMRPDMSLIGKVMGVGIPAGIENGMFQFGKLAIQSSVSTLGTVAIAAQAMTNVLENVNGIGACGVGIALMTVVGQAIGAGRKEEAKYYVVKMFVMAETVIIISCLFVLAITKPVTILGGMEDEAAAMCFQMVCYITIFKPLFWCFSFLTAYGMRAAGDVKFSMIVSLCTMWLCRVAIATFLIRVMHIGILGVWIGMFADWGVRGIIFTLRFLSGKWLEKRVI